MFHLTVRRVYLILLATALAGCGDGHGGVPVSGKVTVQGEPLAEVLVTFEPLEEEGMGSTGTTDAEGRYTLQFVDNQQEGAVPGKHQVTFQDLLDKPAEDTDAGPAPPSKSRLPKSAQEATHEFVIPPEGTSAAEFDLK
jgi:hypothetical protein